MRSNDFTPRHTFTLGALGLAAAAALTLAPSHAQAQQPPPGYPPPGYAPAPGYEPAPPPQGYYVPPSVAASGPRRITDWQDGEPIPPGYHPVSRFRTGLIVGGAVMFGTIYLTNVLVAAVASDTCKIAGCSSTTLGALYAPIAGPFIQIGQTHSAVGNFFLVMDGLLQAGGVAMFIAGFAAPKTLLIRNDLATNKKLELTPMPMTFGQNSAGFGLLGKF